ncbi:AI-2E family transporter [Aureimonas sp. SA4125]|uniref:AI-2E family transporter n=1 Tax=Aureimonas sp. SA4125 TaxID=2826993 RepID=UPI001CC3D204|nr:AI-2E family transporter [Aureimonas sp. SA4125]BDA85536.1 AI-2E family transporter [Aureimonas sp. SA4125]
MTRRTVSLSVLCATFALLLWLAPTVLLVVFAGILMAVFLRGGGEWIAGKLGLKAGYGVAIFCVGLTVCAVVFLGLAGAALADQVQQLWDRLPEAVRTLRGYVEDHAWINQALDKVDPGAVAPSGSGAASALSSTFGAFGNLVIIAFVGIYGAAAPSTYTRGLALLVAPSARPKAQSMLRESGIALRGWLKAQFVSMAVVGILTGLGLWFLGVSLAPILAILAALLTFIPNIGPVLALVPAVLLGLADGVSTALWIVGLYVTVQAIESYLVTPRVQESAVSLPPALTIAVQLLFGVLFGILGLALATPLAAVLLRVGRRFYVEDYLDKEAPILATLR